MNQVNYSHSKDNSDFSKAVKVLKKNVTQRGDLVYVTVKRQLEIIDELRTFPLGRFLIERKGADGFWTDYILNYPNVGALTGVNIEGKPFCDLEKFILSRCPLTIASQERFKIFQKIIQNFLGNGMTLASIPCGSMRDLLTLDFSELTEYLLIGVDFDSQSLANAKSLAKECQVEQHIHLVQSDAWSFSFHKQMDVITSNGLNVYVDDKEKVKSLYKTFFEALKKGGMLVIGVLTYPPGHVCESEWDTRELSSDDILMEQILYQDILGCKWRNFRSSDEILEEFSSVGFSKVDIVFDKHRIFPTVVAIK